MIMKTKFITRNVILNIALVIVAGLTFTACNDLDQFPTSKFTEGNYWNSEDKAQSVLNMAYSQMYDAGYFFNTEALSDNAYQIRISDEKTISSGQANAATGRFANEWGACFNGIKTCHILLENIDLIPDMDETLKERMKAEARFIRAWLFFRLATWYGDVPLFTKDITLSESKTISRTSHDGVLTFVRNELEDIASILPTNRQYAEDDRGHITAGAAIALKARTYLYENDWQNVAATCERLIGTTTYGEYSLFDSFTGLFAVDNEYNDEMMLDISYIPSLRLWNNFVDFAPPSAGQRVCAMTPTQELVDDYIMLNGKSIKESGSGYDENNPYVNRDPRMDATIVRHGSFFITRPSLDSRTLTIHTQPGSTTDETELKDVYTGTGETASRTGYYIRKYYDPTANASFESSLNLILIRYADVLLMYAEAKAELNQLDAAVWNNTVRAIRQRAGFTEAGALDFPGTTGLRDIIRRERRSELAFEGTRIHDIRRWHTAETVLNQPAHGAKFAENNTKYITLEQRSFNPERDYWWPVPQGDKDKNSNLGQNPKY
jgi:hypothetical protein